MTSNRKKIRNSYKEDTGLQTRQIRSDKFPTWTQPKPIGYFSIDSGRSYEEGYRNLRFLQKPEKHEFPLNLNIGLNSAKKKPESSTDEGIEHLLTYIIGNYPQLKTSLDRDRDGNYTQQRQRNPLFPIEFVCCRDLLRRIMCTPFKDQPEWIINVTSFKGTFYFCQEETEVERRYTEKNFKNNFFLYGYKFEQYCLSDGPRTKLNTNVPMDKSSEFSCIFNMKLGGFNLLYGAKMDGIRSDTMVPLDRGYPLDKLEFVELKTSIQINNENQERNFLRYKTRNWWCQSFLVGISNVIVGWRDRNGFVQQIEEIPVKELCNSAKKTNVSYQAGSRIHMIVKRKPPKYDSIEKLWSPHQCACFLVSFLNCVKTLMAAVDCPHTVWQFRYNAINGQISYKVFEGQSDTKCFLSKPYIDFIENLVKQDNFDNLENYKLKVHNRK